MIPFLDLVPGSNVVRFLGTPYQYLSHPKFCLKDSKHFEQKLKCPSYFLTEMKCSICEEGNRGKPRWMIPLLSRRDDKVYLIDINYDEFSFIRELARSSHWGNPEKYDLDFPHEEGRSKIVPIPNMHLPFDASKYPFNKEELATMCAPSIKDLEVILCKNYKEVDPNDR